MKDILKLTFSVAVICALAGAAMVFVHSRTLAPIAAAEQDAQRAKMKFVLPDGVSNLFQLDASEDNDVIVFEALDENTQRLALAVISTSHSGFGGDVRIIEGLALDGSIIGIIVDQSNETPGVGDHVTDRKQVVSAWDALSGKSTKLDFPPNAYLDSFSGKPILGNDLVANQDIQCVSGATISSKAVLEAVNKAGQFIREKNLLSTATPNVN